MINFSLRRKIFLFTLIISTYFTRPINAEMNTCSQEKIEQFHEKTRFFSERKPPLFLGYHSKKNRYDYVRYEGELFLQGQNGIEDKEKFVFYRAKNTFSNKKAPLVFLLTGMGGITPIDRHLAHYYAKSGVNVLLSSSEYSLGLFPLEELKIKLEKSIKTTAALLDHFVKNPYVDANRVSVIGISLGGFRALYLMNLDKRIKSAVLVVTGSSFSESVAFSTQPTIKRLRDYQMKNAQIFDKRNYLKALESHVPFKSSEFLCRRNTKEFYLHKSSSDTTVPSYLQDRLWDNLEKPKSFTSRFGHVGSIIYFAMASRSKALNFMKKSWQF